MMNKRKEKPTELKKAKQYLRHSKERIPLGMDRCHDGEGHYRIRHLPSISGKAYFDILKNLNIGLSYAIKDAKNIDNLLDNKYQKSISKYEDLRSNIREQMKNFTGYKNKCLRSDLARDETPVVLLRYPQSKNVGYAANVLEEIISRKYIASDK
ncbi:MAG: hypothetical protein ACQESF_04765 [Nanobdellota archaeon]